MRLVPNTDTVPASLNRYLLAHERQVITLRRHPASLIPSATAATGGLFAAVAVNPLVNGSETLELTIWLLAGLLFLLLISACISWSIGWFAVTSHRIIFISGILSGRRIRTIPLENLKNITLRRSRGGRILGYGAFIFAADGTYRVVDYIPYPEQLYLEVLGLIFRDSDEISD